MSTDNALTTTEARDLKKLEHRIQAGIQVFHTVGRSLAEIAERKLYRQKYATFQDYCRERWGFGRAHAYRLIAAAEVIEDVSPAGDIEPPSLSAVLPLKQLDSPDSRRAAFEAAAATGTPTAADVQDVVDRMLATEDPAEQQEIAAREKERIVREGRRVEQGRADGDREKRIRKMLASARLVRKDARGLGSEGEEPEGWAESIMRWCCDQLDLDPYEHGLRDAA